MDEINDDAATDTHYKTKDAVALVSTWLTQREPVPQIYRHMVLHHHLTRSNGHYQMILSIA